MTLGGEPPLTLLDIINGLAGRWHVSYHAIHHTHRVSITSRVDIGGATHVLSVQWWCARRGAMTDIVHPEEAQLLADFMAKARTIR